MLCMCPLPCLLLIVAVVASRLRYLAAKHKGIIVVPVHSLVMKVFVALIEHSSHLETCFEVQCSFIVAFQHQSVRLPILITDPI